MSGPRFLSTLVVTLGLALALVSPATAQSVRKGKRGDELQDRIPAVSGPLFLKAGRHEISPIFTLSMADAFRQKAGGGLYYAWHLQEHFALSLRGGYMKGFSSGAVQVCPTQETCEGPDAVTLDRLPGNLTFMATGSGEVSPLYGKLNIIAEWVIHFDIFASVGAGVVGYGNTSGTGTAMGLAIPLAVGQRIFIGEWFALRVEFSDLLYTQVDNNDERHLRGQLGFTLGASFFFPTTFSYRDAH